MTVVIVADVLGKENNGTTVACMNLIRYLKSRGDTVRIVCCDKERSGEEGFYVVPQRNFGPLNWIVRRNNVTIARPDKKIMERAIDGADVVHAMIPFSLGRAALKIAHAKGIPVTAGFHCQAENLTSHLMLMNNPLATKLTYRAFYNLFYKKTDAVHYPTKFIRDTFENAVRKQTNGYVISNGVNDRFVRRETPKPEEYRDKFVILFTGRYAKEKSHRVLIKAVSRSEYKDRIQLIFAGSGPREETIRSYAKQCRILPPLMKFFSRDEMVDVINYADLYCHPAEIELEGIACLEAIRCGLVPVIADSKRCATKEFAVDERNLFRCNDAKDLASKLDFWIEHPELRAEYRQKYLESTAIYRQADCMAAMRTMLEEVTGGQR